MIHEVRIQEKRAKKSQSNRLLDDARSALGITTVHAVQRVKVYRFEGISTDSVTQLAQALLSDSTYQAYAIDMPIDTDARHVVEIGYKPGVMNPEVASIKKAACILGINVAYVDTSCEYHFFGDYHEEELKSVVDNILINRTVQQVIDQKSVSFKTVPAIRRTDTIQIRQMTGYQLRALSHERQLYLDINELKAIKKYFVSINRDPYEADIETIAQTWSEHCCHKTFKAQLIVDGEHKKPLFSRLKETAKKYNKDTLSAFIDNAGVMSFYDDYAICAKVETHNSPSAIEPYGGAATGSGGVFRDIMGTGLGAHVLLSTDMFCLAPPDMPRDEIPVGCLHPRYILQKVVAGVRDYGNRIGIPTSNGSVHFHKHFKAKPTVIVGAYGIMPEKYAHKGEPQPGDLIFTVGGSTGKDGIHGATFSSGSMDAHTQDTHAAAVQIGNPIEQKRMMDALAQCRDSDLIRAITDCGAGGFSSAIGEMAQNSGARVELTNVPLKYTGIAPWQIWVSESQERMICAVPPDCAEQFQQICVNYNTPVAHIGHFTGDDLLKVFFNKQIVCELSLSFLHDGCPERTLHATERTRTTYALLPDVPKNWESIYQKVLGHYNVCSKETIVRQYDHTVQGMHVMAPYAGVQYDGPNDATILAPIRGKKYGMIVAHGLHPTLNTIDPYKGSLWAIVEALSNYVAVGGNYADASLIDNFIWPYPDEHALWDLDRAMDACVDAMNIFGIPFISGKDSLSSTYCYPDGTKLEIPSVLCTSVFGKIADFTKTVSADFKQSDSYIVLLGEIDHYGLGGSAYLDCINESLHAPVPDVSIKELPQRFAALNMAIRDGVIFACHDVSDGGIAIAIAEMAFGGDCGAKILLPEQVPADRFLFSETAGCFIIEVADKAVLEAYFSHISHTILGNVKKEKEIVAFQSAKQLFNVELDTLKKAWKQPLEKVFVQ